MDEPAAARRRVLKAALGGAAAVAAVGGAARWWPGDETPEGRRPTLLLAGDDTAQIDSVEVDLADGRLARPSTRAGWQTDPMSASVYSMLALTWDDPAVSAQLEVRTRRANRWDEWRPVPPLHDRPDHGDQEVGRGGTEIVWTGRCDAVQVRG